jgi:ELWxxDGT repeat protein
MNKSTLLFVFLFFSVQSIVAQVQLTADINPGNSPSNANDFAVYNNKLYFTANDGNVGNELFVYDGVTVSLVADINPGTANSFPGGFTVFNNNLYFRADDGTTGSELFVYDGTSVTLAADINPGTSSSSPYDLTVYNNNLYFRANTPFFGNEFWVYDGTTASIVSDIRPSGSSSPSFLTVYNNKLYFSANNGVTGSELWEYDGTTTALVNDMRPGPLGSNPRFFTVYNNNLYFEANDGSSGGELFVYNGTTTSLVADIRPGTLGSIPADFAVYNNKLFFRANDGNNGAELWEYDGTNVSLVSDINPGTANSNLFSLTVFDNKLYFSADNGSVGYELWVYDGLTASLVDDYLPGIGSSSPIGLTVYGNTLYFQARDVDGTNGPNIHGTELCEYSPCSTTFSTDVISECDSYTWIDGNTYTASNNTATFTLTNAAGCDSIVTLDLTINNSNTGTDVQTACDSYTWIDGNTYTASNNTATFTLTNAAGCDSIVTLDLTINNSNTGTDIITACDSYTWIDGNTYTASNNSATFTLTNAAGCDSIVTLDLTINNSNTGIDVQTACDSYTWIDGNTYMASNNTATWTLTNAAGCDSIVTLDLTINNSNTGTDVITACDSYTWIDGNTYTASNNSATFTLTNAAGCDSLVSLELTILSTVYSTDTQLTCDSLTWIDGNTYYSSNNTATVTLTSSQGCDSIITLDLHVDNTAPTASNPPTLYIQCIDDLGTPSTSWVTDAVDDYTANPLISFVGEVSDGQTCPETLTRTFSVTDNCGNETLVTQTIIVDDQTAPVPDNTTLPAETAFCDVSLTPPTATDNCLGIITGTTATIFPINTTGVTVVTWTFTDACGNSTTQDQIVEIEPIETSVSYANDQVTLLAVNQNIGVTYQWIDCNTSQPVSGATSHNYTPTFGSDFAVIITDAGCSDTSDCFNSTVGIESLSLANIQIYPNPSSGIFSLNFGESIEGVLTVSNMLGQEVLEEYISGSKYSFDFSEHESGVYILQIEMNGGIYEQKLIKR